MSKEFKPTHILHYSEGTRCHEVWPAGVPVAQGYTDKDGMVEWVSDGEGNVAGYSLYNSVRVTPIDH